jgi:hypothetical protein
MPMIFQQKLIIVIKKIKPDNFKSCFGAEKDNYFITPIFRDNYITLLAKVLCQVETNVKGKQVQW